MITPAVSALLLALGEKIDTLTKEAEIREKQLRETEPYRQKYEDQEIQVRTLRMQIDEQAKRIRSDSQLLATTSKRKAKR